MGKKEVSICEIEFTISIDKFFNKCVLYMTWTNYQSYYMRVILR